MLIYEFNLNEKQLCHCLIIDAYRILIHEIFISYLLNNYHDLIIEFIISLRFFLRKVMLELIIILIINLCNIINFKFIMKKQLINRM